jgi:hypothetical protein
MSILTKSTVKMLCAHGDLIRQETLEEAQKLLDLYFDPNVAPEQKIVAKSEIDRIIKEIEDRVTTRRLREALHPKKS